VTPIAIHKSTNKKPRPEESKLAFGRVFTDHMFVADFDRERGWHDPRITPYAPFELDPAATVLHYGQALFEGLKARRGDDARIRLFRPDRHARRMQDGAARLCMPPVDVDMFLAGVQALVRIDHEWVPSAKDASLYLRPTLIATEPFLGVRPADRYVFFIIASPVGAYYAEGFGPVKIWVENECVRAARGGLGAIKAGANYAASLYASEQAKKRGYTQVLWLDAKEHRFFEEVGTMNLFVAFEDEVVTPPLEGSILDGVTRSSVLALLREWGHRVSERPIAIDEVFAAGAKGSLREVFGCGTGAVISPVGELGAERGTLTVNEGRPGPLAKKLYEKLTDIQYARVPDTRSWLVDVPVG
jgi:branched-chain amino acid aminotransferase